MEDSIVNVSRHSRSKIRGFRSELGEDEAPQGEVEEIVAGIWQELLEVERVGRHDNFFELGGHSLLIVQVMERLRREGLSAEIRRVLESPTLAELAGALTCAAVWQIEVPPSLIPPECDLITPPMLPLVALEAQHIERIVQTVPGGAANTQDIYPLAPLQEGILSHHLMDDEDGHTHTRLMLLSVSSRQLLEELIAALQAAIDRHDVLRTAVLWEQMPRPVQVVYRNATLPVQETELHANREPLEELQERIGHQRLDLRRAPLMRLLIAADPRGARWYALLEAHHLVFDNESMEILFSEVKAYREDRTQDLPGSVPYRSQLAQALAYARMHDAEAFFRGKLGDIHEPTAPFGLLDVQESGSQIEGAYEEVAPSLAQRLRAQARRQSVSAATLFHAAWGLVVAHTSGRDDVVLGTMLSGRLHGNAGAQRTLGMLNNTLPLRIRLSGVTTRELVQQTHQELVELLRYEQASLAVAQRCSGITGFTPLFSTILNYFHSTADLDSGSTPASGITLLASKCRTNYPILLSVDDQGEGFGLKLEVDRRIDAHRMLGYVCAAMQSLVYALAEAPQTQALALSILPPLERNQVLELFNATQAAYPEALVHELFEQQARRTPDAVAVVYEGQPLTYAQLNGKANQLAWYLRERGVGADQLVGICVERSPEMVVGLLGILKAGGAYVPLDPGHPAERLAYMLEDSSPRVLLIQGLLKDRVPPTSAEVLALDTQWDAIDEMPTSNLALTAQDLNPGNLAYVIYTSGSTGQPKGAMNEHRAVVNRLQWMQDRYRLDNEDRVLQKTPYSFDVSVWEFFWTLISGARLIVARPEGHKDPGYLRRLIEETGVTRLHFVPSMLQSFLEQHKSGECPSLRHVVCSGEELPVALQNKCFECLPHAKLSNLYGPTEAAVDVTSWECTSEELSSRVPIGRPISNIRMYVLDVRGQPVPIGVTGEIYIGGVGVARGYLNRPELTAERFSKDPFSTDQQARTYKTGDLGRWRADGTIEYLGRNDHQVKIRGFRIELGEIEAQLTLCAGVRDAVVVAREDVAGERRLVAYLTQKNDAALSAAVLRAHLGNRLPQYMLPAAYVVLPELPLTANGKLDRNALPLPNGSLRSDNYEPPQGEIEIALAELWQRLLGVGRVGREDDFLELGGDSLLAVKLIGLIAERLTVQLPIFAAFQHPTIREMSQLVERLPRQIPLKPDDMLPQSVASVATEQPLLRRLPHDRIPLTFSQQFLWNALDLGKRRNVRTISTATRLCGYLDVKSLKVGFWEIIRRHESLRTTIAMMDGIPMQVIDEDPEYDLQIVDLAGISAGDREIEARLVVENLVNERINVTAGPLISALLVKMKDDDYVFAISMDHIISDGISLGILLRDLWTLYQQSVRGVPFSLPEIPVQFADYAVWQRRTYPFWSSKHSRYWTRRLAAAQRVRLPSDQEVAKRCPTTWERLPIQFGMNLSEKLRGMSRKHRVPMVMTVLTIYAALVLRLCKRADLVLRFQTSGRQRPEIQDAIGFFASILYLRVEMLEPDSFLDLLKRVTAEYSTAQEHDDFYEMAARVPQPEFARNTLFNWLTELDANPGSRAPDRGAGGPPDTIRSQLFPYTVRFDDIEYDEEPELALSDSVNGVSGKITYRTDHLSSETAARLIERLQRFAENLLEDPAARIATIAYE